MKIYELTHIPKVFVLTQIDAETGITADDIDITADNIDITVDSE
jgi:hypothetical protein